MERRRAVSAGVKRLNEMALVSGTAHADSHAKLNNRIQSAPVVRHMKTTSTTIQILDNSKPPRESENKENIGGSSNVSSAKDSELHRNKSVSMKEKDERSQRIPSSTKFTFPTPVNYSTPVSHLLSFQVHNFSKHTFNY